jgi:xylulose-5-phosphate/fructose-6-phosphate phosphoketolase
MSTPLSEKELKAMDAYWRAANYLSVGQIYLLDNPLLKRPLKLENIETRLDTQTQSRMGRRVVPLSIGRRVEA